MQSTVFDTLMASDASTVVAAPTGSGKTALFELAIIRLLSATPEGAPLRGKTVCLVPLKALCAERAGEWRAKFGPLGVRVAAITGDGGGAPPARPAAPPPPADVGGEEEWDGRLGLPTTSGGASEVRAADIIVTTPEKWDALTRTWRDNVALVGGVALLLLDEVHTVGDAGRGQTLEAVVSRMKTVASFPSVAAKGWPAANLRIGAWGAASSSIPLKTGAPNSPAVPPPATSAVHH